MTIWASLLAAIIWLGIILFCFGSLGYIVWGILDDVFEDFRYLLLALALVIFWFTAVIYISNNPWIADVWWVKAFS